MKSVAGNPLTVTGEGVAVGDGVTEGTAVAVAVFVGVGVSDGTAVAVGSLVNVGCGDDVAVGKGANVGNLAASTNTVCVGVSVAVGVADDMIHPDKKRGRATAVVTTNQSCHLF